MDHPFRHLGIAVDAFIVFVALFLNLAGLDHPFTNHTAGFAGLHLRQLLEGHDQNLAVDVDSVE